MIVVVFLSFRQSEEHIRRIKVPTGRSLCFVIQIMSRYLRADSFASILSSHFQPGFLFFILFANTVGDLFDDIHSQLILSAASRYPVVRYSTILNAPASIATQLKTHANHSIPQYTMQIVRTDITSSMLEQNGRLCIMARLAIWRCSAMESAIRRREQVRSEVVVTMYSSYSSSAITIFLITLVGTSVSEGEVELIVLSDELVFVVVGE